MPLIPQEEIDALKSTLHLPSLLESQGLTLRPSGKNLLTHCPFHDDKTPSLVVSFKDGCWLWHCLGACNEGGTAIQWTQRRENLPFPKAVKWLQKWMGNRNGTSPKALPKSEISADDQGLLKEVIDFYHRTLLGDELPKAYLKKRGLYHPEAIQKFKIGYANRSIANILPDRQSVEGKKAREDLLKLGILYGQKKRELFDGSIVIPIVDENGTITEVYGRKTHNKLRKGTIYHLYLPGPHRGIWNPDCLKNDTIILTESLIDGLTFYVNGFCNVTSSYGVNGYTEDHQKTFLSSKIRTVYIAYDRDEGGEKAAWKLAEEMLIPHGIHCYHVKFPRGLDANEFALKAKDPKEALRQALDTAEWMDPNHPEPKRESFNPDDVLEIQTEKSLPSLAAKKAIQGGYSLKFLKVAKEKNQTESLLATEIAGKENTSPETSKIEAKRETKTVSSLAAEKETTSEDPQNGSDTPVKKIPGGLEISFGKRMYQIYGLGKNLSSGTLQVSICAQFGDRAHGDQINFWKSVQKDRFIKKVAEELSQEPEVIKRDMNRIFRKLTEMQQDQIEDLLGKKKKRPKAVVLTERQVQEALDYLKKPNLLNRIIDDFKRCGLVGEETNSLVGYLVSISRKLKKPLAIIIQSSSAAGKSTLMEKILSFCPSEDVEEFSTMTGQSLYYITGNLKHKILAISEEEGLERARYAIKILQSEKRLKIAYPTKNPQTGEIETREKIVEGPVVIFTTTTNIEIDEELENRFIILTVNESREQTRAILAMQRSMRTLEGLNMAQDHAELTELHRNAQSLLMPLEIVNPFSSELTYMDNKLRIRRDHEKYLSIIDAIALLHQYQRPIKQRKYKGKVSPYVEVTLEDIEAANCICNEILGRSLDDLTPQTHKFMGLLHEMVQKKCKAEAIEQRDCLFSQREAREYTGWSSFQVKKHISRLVELEYLLVHKGKRGHSYLYELLYQGEGQDGNPFILGLLDVQKIKKKGQIHT